MKSWVTYKRKNINKPSALAVCAVKAQKLHVFLTSFHFMLLLFTSSLWVIFPPQVTVPGQVVDVACGVDHMVALAKSLLWASCPHQRWIKPGCLGRGLPLTPGCPGEPTGGSVWSREASCSPQAVDPVTRWRQRRADCAANFHWHCSFYSLFLRSCGKDIQA